MVALPLLITLDYEVYGNGLGDVRKVVIEPTNRLLDILARHQITMTVFFELEEFLVFRKHAEELRSRWGYDPAQEIELQLRHMVEAGHEIGLHIHPQWIDAQFDGERFTLSQENLCLFDVYKTERELTAYLRNRSATLTELVQKYNPSYQITSFRAGGHALRPEQLTLKALHDLGIKAESSVVAGLYRKGEGYDLDFRDAPANKGYWRVRDNVCMAEQQGNMLEFPIYSRMAPEFTKLSFNRIRAKFFSTGPPSVEALMEEAANRGLPGTPWGILRHLLRKTPLKFDFCHMTCKEMLSFTQDHIGDNSPLTMIGHSKEYYNDREFAAFLATVRKKNPIKFMTMAQAVAMADQGAL